MKKGTIAGKSEGSSRIDKAILTGIGNLKGISESKWKTHSRNLEERLKILRRKTRKQRARVKQYEKYFRIACKKMGLDYIKYLDSNNVPPLPKWKLKNGNKPKTYLEASRDPSLRRKIWRENSRYRHKFASNR